MNLRPSGYEPDELPDCSTPRQGSRPGRGPAGVASMSCRFGVVSTMSCRYSCRRGGRRPRAVGLRTGPVAGGRSPVEGVWPVLAGRARRLGRPGGDLLSHVSSRSTIGAEGFHGRVRDGIGWGPLAMTTRSPEAATSPGSGASCSRGPSGFGASSDRGAGSGLHARGTSRSSD